jgi:hypothetical protein
MACREYGLWKVGVVFRRGRGCTPALSLRKNEQLEDSGNGRNLRESRGGISVLLGLFCSEISTGFDRFTPNIRSFLSPCHPFSPVIMGFSYHNSFFPGRRDSIIEKNFYWDKLLYTGVKSFVPV